jgi:thiamine-phosphate pyrophosphorylase
MKKGGSNRKNFKLYVIADKRSAGGRPLDQVIDSALAGSAPGQVAVQLREKDMASGDLLALAGRLAVIVHWHGGYLLVSDRADVAMAAGADGVHLPRGSMPASEIRKFFPSALIGASTHSVLEAIEAERDGADFVVTGPVHPTPSKPGAEPMGATGLARVCMAVNVPVFALGGIDTDNALSAVIAGAAGVACKSAVMSAGNPSLAVAGIIGKIGKARP